MRHVRTVKASNTHSAHWFNVSIGEINAAFGKDEINHLLERLGNGKTSVSNMSLQMANGSMQYADIQLPIEYDKWAAIGKPLSSVDFWIVKFSEHDKA